MESGDLRGVTVFPQKRFCRTFWGGVSYLLRGSNPPNPPSITALGLGKGIIGVNSELPLPKKSYTFWVYVLRAGIRTVFVLTFHTYHYYVMLILISRSVTSANIAINDRHKLNSFGYISVTDYGKNRKLMCDFLLVININLAPILHRFRDIAFDSSKITIFGNPSCV